MKKNVLLFILLLTLLTSCSQNTSNVNSISENDLLKIKNIIIDSEKLFSHEVREDLIGTWSFIGAIYALKNNSSYNDFKNQMLNYYNENILEKVLYTHEIYVLDNLCGYSNISITDGRYYVDINGSFIMKSYKNDIIQMEVPFEYKGVDGEEPEKAIGVYSIKKINNKYLIMNIEQKYNDWLYNLTLENGSDANSFKGIEAFEEKIGTWNNNESDNSLVLHFFESNDYYLSVYFGVTLGSGNITKTKMDIKHFNFINENTIKFAFDDDGYGNKGKGTLTIENDSIVMDITLDNEVASGQKSIKQGETRFYKAD